AVTHSRLITFEQRYPLWAAAVLVLIIAIAVLSGAYRKPIATPGGCPPAFLIAHNLLEHGTFSRREPAGSGSQVLSERPMAPAYPVLATLAKADPQIAKGIACAGLSNFEHTPG